MSIHSPNSQSASSPEEQQVQSPGQLSTASSPSQHQTTLFQTAAAPNPSSLLTEWALHQQAQQASGPDLSQFMQDPSLITFNPFTASFQPASLDYLPTSLPTTQAALEASMRLDSTFNTMSPVDDAPRSMQWGMGMANWQDFETAT